MLEALRRAPGTLGLALLVGQASGCSWAFMQRAPTVVSTPNYPVDCTSSRAAPVLDTVCAGYFALNGVTWAALMSTSQDSELQTMGVVGIGVSAGLIGLCLASGVSGFGYADRCEQVKDLNAQCITGREDACQSLNPSWVPKAPPPVPAPALPAGPPASVPPPAPGCAKDTDCKGDRVCERGTCVEPQASTPPAPDRQEEASPRSAP